MKVMILAGGVGSRLSEETVLKPKPMVEIGGRPILWHIMKHYAHYGHKSFFVALGYKAEVIKQWMRDYADINSDLTVDFKNGTVTRHECAPLDWTVKLVDTGINTMTGGRIKRLAREIGHEPFFLTWGDGVSDVNLDDLLKFHRSHGKLATVTAVRPIARFGHLELRDNQVVEFSEKPQVSEGWINGAYFVLEPQVFDYIEGDDTQFERAPLQRLAAEGQLMAYFHTAFWQCMDTLREKVYLEELWNSGAPPWKIW